MKLAPGNARSNPPNPNPPTPQRRSYDIGATSGALISLTDPAVSGTAWGPALSSLQGGLVVSLSLLGALAGSAGALAWGDALGRRRELLLAAALYAGGAAGAAAAPELGALYAARLVYGLGIGFAMHAAPAYIAEAAPPRVRGLLISLKEAFIVGGILAGCALAGWLGGGWAVCRVVGWAVLVLLF